MWYVKKLGQWKVKKGNFGELQNCFNLNSSKKHNHITFWPTLTLLGGKKNENWLNTYQT